MNDVAERFYQRNFEQLQNPLLLVFFGEHFFVFDFVTGHAQDAVGKKSFDFNVRGGASRGGRTGAAPQTNVRRNRVSDGFRNTPLGVWMP